MAGRLHWFYKTSRALVEANKGVPSEIVRIIANMLKTGQFTLTKERPATEQETALAESGGAKVRRPHLVSEKLAEIRGLEALRDDNDLRKLLILDLGANLKCLETLDVEALNPREAARWSKWINTVDGVFDRAEAAIAAGRALLTPENLRPFGQMLRDPADLARFESYLKGI